MAQELTIQSHNRLEKECTPPYTFTALRIFTLVVNSVLLGLSDRPPGFPVEAFSFGEVYSLIFHLSSFDGCNCMEAGYIWRLQKVFKLCIA